MVFPWKFVTFQAASLIFISKSNFSDLPIIWTFSLRWWTLCLLEACGFFISHLFLCPFPGCRELGGVLHQIPSGTALLRRWRALARDWTLDNLLIKYSVLTCTLYFCTQLRVHWELKSILYKKKRKILNRSYIIFPHTTVFF